MKEMKEMKEMSGSMGSKGDRSPVDGYRERWRRGKCVNDIITDLQGTFDL